MPPENEIYNSYSDHLANRHCSLVYIPSPYSLSAASYLQHSLDQGVKRKRDQEEDENSLSGVDLFFTLLQTSMCKLQRTQTVTSRGRRKSTSLRRSVLIFNMFNSLQNDNTVKSGISPTQKVSIPSASSLVDDGSLADEESIVSLDSLKDKCDDGKTLPCSLTLIDDLPEIERDINGASDDMVNSFSPLTCDGVKSVPDRHVGRDLVQEMNVGSGSCLESYQTPLEPEENSDHFSVSQTHTFLSDEVFDLEASLFDVDYFDSYLPTSSMSTGCLKDVVPQCGRKLEIFDGDLEYLMQVLANS